MSRRAWSYVWSAYLAAAALTLISLPGYVQAGSLWVAFLALTTLATFAQLFEAVAPGRQSYYATMAFLFAGVLLLNPLFFALLVIVPHLIEWGKARLLNSPRLKDWYLQPFNIANHILAGLAAMAVYDYLQAGRAFALAPSAVMAGILAALIYVVANHLITGYAVVLARGVTWRESGVLDPENVVTDLVLALLGYVVAILWRLNPWLILPALSPLLLIYRSLMIPQLRKEAQTDEKTGLWNARHFSRLFAAEVERARRFDRPLAVIMADLDLLRNINNTYGHLAGDAVLSGIAQIICKAIRDYDVAGRFGGEEFCIVLPEASRVDAQAIAERLREAVEQARFSVSTSPTPICATVSLGVACYPWDATAPSDLIHQADVAVYQAKLRGRNCVVAANDVPRFVRLNSPMAEDRLSAPYVPTFVPRPDTEQPQPLGKISPSETPRPPERRLPPESATPERNYPPAFVNSFLGAVIALAVAVSVGGLLLTPQVDPIAIALVVTLALVAQASQMKNLYGESSISVSVGINFAAAFIGGLPGVTLVSLAIVMAHKLRSKPVWYKTAYNWATHVLAGAAPVVAIKAVSIPFEVNSLPLLGTAALVAGLAYFLIDTGLIASAICLSEGKKLLGTWRERYAWLVGHYLVLCVMGLFLSIAYVGLGPLGLVVFALPLLMMHYVQKEYIKRTETSVRELKRMNQELTLAHREILNASLAIRQLNDELFLALSKIIDARDPYVLGHATKVADYATALAEELHLPGERVEKVRQAAFLHDIGKIGVPEHILNKPSRLTAEEFRYVKNHVTLGAEFLETCQGLRHLAPFVLHHHEWWDGRGYPGGLLRDQTPLEARILALCDAVEAMASDRPYHQALSVDQIIREIRRCSGTQFDPVVAEAFIRLAERDGAHLVINSARDVLPAHKDDPHLIHFGNIVAS